MAISTQGMVLTVKSGAATPIVVEIKDFPDLGAEPEMVETTTLLSAVQTFELGVQAQDSLEFTLNYDKGVYDALKDIDTIVDNDYTVSMGTVSEGSFSWVGAHSIYLVGAGTNAPLELKLVCIPSTAVEIDA